MIKDFSISDNGELVYDNTNITVEETDSDKLRRQIAVCRIKSVTGDWFNEKIGANIEFHLGMPNTLETAETIMQAITSELTEDYLVKTEDLFIIPKVTENGISLLVFINKLYGEGPVIINVEIDIVGGVKVYYDINK